MVHVFPSIGIRKVCFIICLKTVALMYSICIQIGLIDGLALIYFSAAKNICNMRIGNSSVALLLWQIPGKRLLCLAFPQAFGENTFIARDLVFKIVDFSGQANSNWRIWIAVEWGVVRAKKGIFCVDDSRAKCSPIFQGNPGGHQCNGHAELPGD